MASYLHTEAQFDSPKASASSPNSPARRRELSLVHGELYDLKPFEQSHPGGQAMLRLAYGRDATELFESVHALADRAYLTRALQRYRVDRADVHPSDVPSVSDAPSFAWAKLSPFAAELRAEVRTHFEREASRRGVSLREASKATWAKLGCDV
ncbi:hypothetical protein T492DRAFT_871973 [Pavlovales sp. CCMP2436]|nr:hypothetical protein T492DRAFT_871973 [Pavlovales sp. CCMP2436]